MGFEISANEDHLKDKTMCVGKLVKEVQSLKAELGDLRTRTRDTHIENYSTPHHLQEGTSPGKNPQWQWRPAKTQAYDHEPTQLQKKDKVHTPGQTKQ